MSGKVLMQKVKYNGFDPKIVSMIRKYHNHKLQTKLSEPGKINFDPGQATVVVFPDTMYTFRVTQGGGSKLIPFPHI